MEDILKNRNELSAKAEVMTYESTKVVVIHTILGKNPKLLPKLDITKLKQHQIDTLVTKYPELSKDLKKDENPSFISSIKNMFKKKTNESLLSIIKEEFIKLSNGK